MLEKIISGGQTGADRAALDLAIKHKIPHGGWIPKGRLTEDGSLPNKYQLQEMPTASYPKRTEQNVIDSDGTLIISRGKLSSGSDYTREMALKHRKQLLGIDLQITNHQQAASLIASWISLRRIKVLNVAGPRASEDPQIYSHVLIVLELSLQMLRDEAAMGDIKPKKPEYSKRPKTVVEAVEILISEIPLKDRMYIASMDEDDLVGNLHFSLGMHIRNQFGLWSGNTDLLEACRQAAEIEGNSIHPDTASSIIIKALWKHLKQTHKLRVMK